MIEPTEAMRTEAEKWARAYEVAARKREEESRRKYGRELESGWEAFFVNDAWEAEGLATEAFVKGMVCAAELIGKMVKTGEDEPGIVLSGDPFGLRGMPVSPEQKKRDDEWAAQLAEAQKNAPPPLSERITNGEWLK